MSWTAFVKWISSWFTYGDKQFQRIEATQTEIIGFQLQILNEVQKLGSGNSDAVLQQLSLISQKADKIMADLATVKADLAQLVTDVNTMKTTTAQQIADLKAQIAAGSPVTQADLDEIDATIKGLDTDVTTP